MEAFTNITGISPDADPSEIMAMMAANTDAVQYSNQALQASNRGDYSTAIELHQKALKMKVDAFGTESVQAAITYNGLGENYLKMGHLDAAESAFEKALRVRDTLGMGPANDAAATRDNMGQLYEAKGPEYFEKAREIRLKGAANGQTMCGNENVGFFIPLNPLPRGPE